MKVKKKKVLPFVSMFIVIIFLTGCTTSSLSTSEIIERALEAKKKDVSYYAETWVKTHDTEKQKREKMFVKEWYDAPKKVHRSDIYENGELTQSIFLDNEKVKMYDKQENTVYTMDLDEKTLENSLSQSKFLMTMLGDIQKTHKIELIGEEKVIGRKVYHIKAVPKKEATLMQNQEYWIDQETWMVLKSKVQTGDTFTHSEYVKIDFKPKFKKNIFTFRVPKDAKWKSMEDLTGVTMTTLDEAKEALKQPFYYWNNDEMKISSIECFNNNLDETDKRKEITFNYMTNGEPILSLTIFKTPNEVSAEESTRFKKVHVHGQVGEYMDDSFRSLVWDEDGLRYSIILESPDVTLEHTLKLIDQMILSTQSGQPK